MAESAAALEMLKEFRREMVDLLGYQHVAGIFKTGCWPKIDEFDVYDLPLLFIKLNHDIFRPQICVDVAHLRDLRQELANLGYQESDMPHSMLPGD